MKRVIELCFLCLVGIVVGLATNKISVEVSMLQTLKHTVSQNQYLCERVQQRNQQLLAFEEANLNLKSSLDESVALITGLTVQVEELSRDIDRLEYLVSSKERTIKELQKTITELRQLIKEVPNDTNDSVPVPAT